MRHLCRLLCAIWWSAHDRIWLLPDTARLWDHEGLVRAWLDGHAELVLERAWRGVLLLRYHTPRYLEQEIVPLDARLETPSGAEITLLGYSLRDDEGRAVERLAVEPGGEVRLTLYWRAESAVDRRVRGLLSSLGWDRLAARTAGQSAARRGPFRRARGRLARR